MDTSPHISRAFVVLAVATVARLLIASAFPLVPDETYYWEWSRHLSAGYFDHPPMLAWCIAVGRAILGDTPIGVRLVPVLCGTIAGAAVMLAARELFDGRAMFRVALVFAVLPLSAAGLVLATPDAPLMAAGAVTVWAMVRALDARIAPRTALAWWCVAGIAAGLGMESKLTGVLIPAFIALACAIIPSLRRVFRTPGPYTAIALASLIVAPLLVWNSSHGWITFGYQFVHGLGSPNDTTVVATVSRVASLAGGQLGLTAIVLGVLLFVAVVRAARGALGPREQMLGVVSACCLGFFVVSALRKPVEANWPAIAYPPAIILIGALGADGIGRQWLQRGVLIASVMSLSVYAYAAGVIPPIPLRGAQDPLDAAYGWRVLADSMSRVARDDAPGASTFLAADRYQDASELAFASPGGPFVFSLNLAGRNNQYDLWKRFPDTARVGDALVAAVDESEGPHEAIAKLTSHFASVERRMLVSLPRAGRTVATRRVWLLKGWRGSWPRADFQP